MTDNKRYDVAVIGGGLGGLALSIQLARAGHRVILFEKETYPFHRVCGEYISLESLPFLQQLGIDIAGAGIPVIREVSVSDRHGRSLQQAHPMGGLGVSRWWLDSTLADIARKEGVELREATRITEVRKETGGYRLRSQDDSFQSRLAAGSFGKRSNLDLQWKRSFTKAAEAAPDNFIGVKYHVTGAFPESLVQLHLFPGGYAGLVRIENERYNLCYLTTAANLKASGGSIPQMEKEILGINPRLRGILEQATKVNEKPVTISQISFRTKTPVENEVLMLGDAAGMITPLCGNGMSMALHASKIAFRVMDDQLRGRISMEQMFQQYTSDWKAVFRKRLARGRVVQRILFHPIAADVLLWLGRRRPALADRVMRLTHGQPY